MSRSNRRRIGRKRSKGKTRKTEVIVGGVIARRE